MGSAREVLAQQRFKAALVARYGSHVIDDSEAVAELGGAIASAAEQVEY
jgi:hypothetical protein